MVPSPGSRIFRALKLPETPTVLGGAEKLTKHCSLAQTDDVILPVVSTAVTLSETSSNVMVPARVLVCGCRNHTAIRTENAFVRIDDALGIWPPRHYKRCPTTQPTFAIRAAGLNSAVSRVVNSSAIRRLEGTPRSTHRSSFLDSSERQSASRK